MKKGWKIALIVTGVALVGGSIWYYYFKAESPKEAKEKRKILIKRTDK